jgi:hypothetical protein
MPVIESGLFTVCKKFPDYTDNVKMLFRESEAFRMLCKDYVRCAEALRYWNHNKSGEAPARREEYKVLLQSLEAEIMEKLNESE